LAETHACAHLCKPDRSRFVGAGELLAWLRNRSQSIKGFPVNPLLVALISALSINGIGVVFMLGIYYRTVNDNVDDIKKLKGDVEVHDRELGSVYGALQMPREVRR
jgi:hypothetical protein